MVVAFLIFGGDFNLDPGFVLVVGLVVGLVIGLVVALVVAFLTLVFVRLIALVDLVVDALFFFSLVAMVVALTFATVAWRLRRVAILLFFCFALQM